MQGFIQYIIKFLLGEENSYLVNKVEYAYESSAAVVIVPSAFFDDNIYMTQASMPCVPLKEINGIPLLFGDNKIEQTERQFIVKADIIASTFFLITRYEECINKKNCDKYGRMLGKESLPYRAGFLMRPIVDEYGKILREWLRKVGISVKEPPEGYQHVYLTHDVDQIWQLDSLYQALRTFIKRVVLHKKNMTESLKLWYNYEKYDKIYTFPWLVEMDGKLESYLGHDKCTKIYFIKTGGKSKFDDAYYKKRSRVKKLLFFLKKNGAVFGIHSSFSAGEMPEKINIEKKRLEKILKEEIKWNRNHYLNSRNPEDMEYLILAGITDDFTMGYADVIGFRLGTCKPVKWINPFSKKVTSLTLHPLTIMEATFAEEYLDLTEVEAFNMVSKMLNVIRQFYGEVVLLWHNSSVGDSDTSYQRSLYKKTLEILKALSD